MVTRDQLKAIQRQVKKCQSNAHWVGDNLLAGQKKALELNLDWLLLFVKALEDLAVGDENC